MSHSLNSLKGAMKESVIRVLKGDTRSLDYGLYISKHSDSQCRHARENGTMTLRKCMEP